MRRAENKQRFAVLGQGQASGQAKLGSPRRKVNWGAKSTTDGAIRSAGKERKEWNNTENECIFLYYLFNY